MTSKKNTSTRNETRKNLQIVEVRSIQFPQTHTGLFKTHRRKKINTKHHYAVFWISSKKRKS